jgi:hypothetical protein
MKPGGGRKLLPRFDHVAELMMYPRKPNLTEVSRMAFVRLFRGPHGTFGEVKGTAKLALKVRKPTRVP